jgi:hypothetical protein
MISYDHLSKASEARLPWPLGTAQLSHGQFSAKLGYVRILGGYLCGLCFMRCSFYYAPL